MILAPKPPNRLSVPNMNSMPLAYAFKRSVFLTINLVAVCVFLPPQHARAQGATGTTETAPGVFAQPAQGETHLVATNSAFGLGADAGTGAAFVDATAIGASSVAGAGAIALGHRANGTGLRAIAIGTDAGGITPAGIGALANAQEAIALGPDAFAHAAGAEAIGLNSNAAGVNSISMGTTAFAGQATSLAIGTNAVANNAAGGSPSTAIGANTSATGADATASGGANRPGKG